MNIDLEDIFQSLLKLGLTHQEIEDKIEQKVEDFQNFMSKEAILFLIAQEMGINKDNIDLQRDDYNNLVEDKIDYDEFTINISEIVEETQNITILGRIRQIFPIRDFTHKDGTPGTVGSFVVEDKTDKIKVTLWNEKVSMMSHKYFQKNEIVRIINGYSKLGLNNNLEVHLNKRSKIILSPDNINPNKVPSVVQSNDLNQSSVYPDYIKIENINLNYKNVNLKAYIKNIYPFKKIDKKVGNFIYLRKIIINDATKEIYVNFWEEFAKIPDEFKTGNYLVFKNLKVKFNNYFNEIDLEYNKFSSYKIEPSSPFKYLSIRFLNESDQPKKYTDYKIRGKFIKIIEFKEIKKNKDIKFLLKIFLDDGKNSINVNIWDMEAIKWMKELKLNDEIEFSNFHVNFNSFSNKKEITLSNNSNLKILND